MKRIVSFGSAGDEKVIAKGVEAYNIATTAKGEIYFTDQIHRSIGLIDAAGNVRTVYDGGEIAQPAGIALSPDQAMVVVTDAQARFAWSFQIAPDGSLENGEPFYRLEIPEQGWMSQVLSVQQDAGGASYFATPEGIQVCEASGRVIEILNAPVPGTQAGELSSVAFAGAGPTWLYAVQAGKLYRRPVKVTYAGVWAPEKPPKPLL